MCTLLSIREAAADHAMRALGSSALRHQLKVPIQLSALLTLRTACLNSSGVLC